MRQERTSCLAKCEPGLDARHAWADEATLGNSQVWGPSVGFQRGEATIEVSIGVGASGVRA